jgi:hypothetical protein
VMPIIIVILTITTAILSSPAVGTESRAGMSPDSR